MVLCLIQKSQFATGSSLQLRCVGSHGCLAMWGTGKVAWQVGVMISTLNSSHIQWLWSTDTGNASCPETDPSQLLGQTLMQGNFPSVNG